MKEIPSAQPETHDKRTETHACDCISRKEAIDLFPDDDLECDTKGGYIAPHLARQMICELPSAQPDSKETSSTHKALDTISRQAAIDAILAVTGNSSVRELYEHVQEHGLSDMWSGGVNAAIDIIIAVPSAQPEIIRCKDCIFHGLCRTSPKWAVAPKDDWYCADAERRTDG